MTMTMIAAVVTVVLLSFASASAGYNCSSIRLLLLDMNGTKIYKRNLLIQIWI